MDDFVKNKVDLKEEYLRLQAEHNLKYSDDFVPSRDNIKLKFNSDDEFYKYLIDLYGRSLRDGMPLNTILANDSVVLPTLKDEKSMDAFDA